MMYAGLTDDPVKRKKEHREPPDFKVVQEFTSEPEALKWERDMIEQGYMDTRRGKEWHYGYICSVM